MDMISQKKFHSLRRRIRKAGITACLAALMTGGSACIEIQSSPLDTSQGGLLGFLSLIIRGTAGSTLVAVGANGLAYTSSDATNWQISTVVADATITLHDVIWTGTRFIAVGGNGSACSIFYSDDGFAWTNAITPACPIRLLAVAASTDGQRVVAVGDLAGPTPLALTSADGGVNWSPVVTGGTIRYLRLIFVNNQFVAFTGPLSSVDVGAFTSDGTSTFTITANPPMPGGKGSTLGDAIAVGNRIIVASTDPSIGAPSPMRTSTTTDNGATIWTGNVTNVFGGSTTNVPRAMAISTAGRLIAVGDACTVDGTSDLATLNWSGVPSTISGCSGVDWMAMIYDGSRFLAVGNDGGGAGFAAFSATGDAGNWTQSGIGSTLLYSLARKP